MDPVDVLENQCIGTSLSLCKTIRYSVGGIVSV